MRSTKYFEDFLIIGIDHESLEPVTDVFDRLVPKTLYEFPKDLEGENSNERTKVVKDFCFPNGVIVE